MRWRALQFLLGAGAVDVERVEVAVDELDGLEEAAGGLALPDFAEAAAAERFDQAVAGDRLGVRLLRHDHLVDPEREETKVSVRVPMIKTHSNLGHE